MGNRGWINFGSGVGVDGVVEGGGWGGQDQGRVEGVFKGRGIGIQDWGWVEGGEFG